MNVLVIYTEPQDESSNIIAVLKRNCNMHPQEQMESYLRRHRTDLYGSSAITYNILPLEEE